MPPRIDIRHHQQRREQPPPFVVFRGGAANGGDDLAHRREGRVPGERREGEPEGAPSGAELRHGALVDGVDTEARAAEWAGAPSGAHRAFPGPAPLRTRQEDDHRVHGGWLAVGALALKSDPAERLIIVHAIGEVVLVAVLELDLERVQLPGEAEQEGLVEPTLGRRDLGVGPSDDVRGPAADIRARERLGVTARDVAEGDVGVAHERLSARPRRSCAPLFFSGGAGQAAGA